MSSGSEMLLLQSLGKLPWQEWLSCTASLIFGQGTYPGFKFNPLSGVYKRQLIHVSPSQ